MGVIAKSEMEKVTTEKDVYIVDLDSSRIQRANKNLSHAGFNVNLLEEKDKSMAAEYANDNNIDLLIVIPKDLANSVTV